MAKYCLHCGAMLNDEDKFCLKCGKHQPTAVHYEGIKGQKKTHTVRNIIIIVCAGVVMVGIFAAALFLGKALLSKNSDSNQSKTVSNNSSFEIQKDEDNLPALSEFESLMNNAIIDFCDSASIDAVAKNYLIKDYSVTDMSVTESTNDYMITGTYGPNKTVGLTGIANNGKVDMVYTFIPWSGVEVDDEYIGHMALTVMIPAGLYDEQYTNMEGLYGLLEKLVQTGMRDEKDESTTLVLDNIEYTLYVSNAMISFSINAKDENKSPNASPVDYIDNNDAPDSPKWKAVYADVLDALIRDFPELEDMCNYTLYDIDENGIPELFVKNCNVFHVYGFSEQSETPIDLGELDASAWHGSICGIEGKNQFLVWGVQQFYEIITLVTLQDDKLVEKTIFEDAVENEHELSPLKVYDLADRSGLMKWAGNESEQNLFALTNYQKIAYDQGGKQYEEKDEQLHISSTDRYDEQMWMPIFSDFVEAHFSGKQVDWNFVGRNENGDYDLNRDGYEDCILIFSVMDGNQQSYFVMPYGEIPDPKVYILKPDGTFRLVWQGQYEDYYDEELLHPQW